MKLVDYSALTEKTPAFEEFVDTEEDARHASVQGRQHEDRDPGSGLRHDHGKGLHMLHKSQASRRLR